MPLSFRHALLPLSEHSPQRWPGTRGRQLRARSGVVWITVDHELQDVVLQPGEQWTADSARPLTVSALGAAAWVEFCDPAVAASGFWPQRLRPLRHGPNGESWHAAQRSRPG